MHTFLINLDNHEDRLSHMIAQFAAFDLKFERIPAVAGCAVPEHMVDKFFVGGELGSRLSSGEVGCYASHLRAYEIIIQRGLKHALILEDDVIIDRDLPALAILAVSKAPSTWDIIKLCNQPRKSVAAIGRVLDRHLVRFLRQPASTEGYLISSEGAAKMLNFGLRSRPIDLEMRMPWMFGLEQYGIVPAPVRSGSFPSSIGVRGTDGSPEYASNKLHNAKYVAQRVPLVTRLTCFALDTLKCSRVVTMKQ